MLAKKADIVLVEDNPDDAELVIRALRKSGISNPLVHLHDGEEALNFLFNDDQACEHRPRLILLDLKMPKVDGLEVLRRVKADETLRLIPVVLLTSSREDKDIFESYQLGVNSYVVKPVEFEKLMETVNGLGLYWLLLNQSCHL